MGNFIDRLAARSLHVLPPEAAHNLALRVLERFPTRTPRPEFPASLRVRTLGLDFVNPVGLAAGFDKDAHAMAAFANLGWGFVEIGGITPHPQAGNPKPRLFRLADRTIVNRMGFNSQGMATVRERLSRRPAGLPLLANLGANRETPDPATDWETLMRGLVGTVDAFTLNVSSPNTASLRNVRRPEALDQRLARIIAVRNELAETHQQPLTPVLVKLSPDHADSEYQEIGEICLRHGIDGITATNSSAELCAELARDRPGLSGGLSGQPLRKRATQVIRLLRRAVQGTIPLIGVGGIATAADAYERIRAGATLVQVYSAMVWEGPRIGPCISRGLTELLERDGHASVTDAIGLEAG